MKLQQVLALLTPYSLFISILYLFGFWSSFNVNVLEYIALSDVLKSAMTPLLYSALLVTVGFSIGNMLGMPLAKHLPAGGGQHLPVARYVRLAFKVMFWVLLSAIIYQIVFDSGNYRWFKVAALSMLIVPVIVGDARELEDYIPYKHVRVIVVNVLVAVAVYAFGWGAIDAKAAKTNEQDLKINGLEVEHQYVGWAGDYLFLWDNKNSTVIAKAKRTVDSIEFSVTEEKSIFERYTTINKPNKEI
ncbi:hypothetical protein [Vibrio chagasii]|uniref:hypothetical protein n=1 Tax=Vibrio chagasii TaxID=170679 RepID=UPI00163F97AC|nr:hypothetical protein [Vibrio chagasii]